MASFNRVILVGNLTRDVELRYVQSGKAVTDIGLAINDKYKNQAGEWVDDTTFVDITAWARTAEVLGEYCRKGDRILVEGRLKYDTWDDPQTGKKRSKLSVVCERMQMLQSKDRQHPTDNQTPQYSEPVQQTKQQPIPDDDVPF